MIRNEITDVCKQKIYSTEEQINIMKGLLIRNILLLIILIFAFISSCKNDDWEDHYSDYDEEVDIKLWDAVRQESRFTEFVDWIEGNGLDTLFDSGSRGFTTIPNR